MGGVYLIEAPGGGWGDGMIEAGLVLGRLGGRQGCAYHEEWHDPWINSNGVFLGACDSAAGAVFCTSIATPSAEMKISLDVVTDLRGCVVVDSAAPGGNTAINRSTIEPSSSR